MVTNPLTTEEQYKEDIKIALDELRARYGRCNSNYDQLQSKFFALLAGQLTVATLLFAGGFSDGKFNIPTALYGQIGFAAGVILMAAALGLSFFSVSSNKWAEAPELKRILANEEIKAHPGIDFLERVKADYESAIQFCGTQHQKRIDRLDWSIKMFVLSFIILVWIKFGGG